MKKKFLSYLLVAALCAPLLGVGLPMLAKDESVRVIVTFEHTVNSAAQSALLNKAGHSLKELSLVNGAVVTLPSKAKVGELLSVKGVKSVEEDVVVYALGKSNPSGKGKPGGSTPPPAQNLEWGVNRIDADFVWSATGTNKGAGVKVAVLDTGIDKLHSDLSVVGGVNFVVKRGRVNSSDWNDDNGHGTHVAGIVAALDNSIGVVGVAPEASLYAVKVLDSRGSGYLSDIILGLQWAVDNQMSVVNMSLGTSSDSLSLHNAVDAAAAAGVLLVAAAGNSGDGNPATNNVGYPAKYDSVIAVGATNSSDGVPSWSSDGAEVEVSAPGASVRSTYKGNNYATLSGTSMASPHTAGVVALMLSSGVLPADARALLSSTSEDLGTAGHDVFYGNGLVDAQAAVGL